MRLGAVLSAALAVLTIAPSVSATEAASAPLASRVPEVATRFCIDILSREVPLPASPDEEAKLFSGYGLGYGLPSPAMQALGPDVSLIAQATLASGNATDGAFMVALGGSAGESCRIILYRAPLDGLFIKAMYDAMQMPSQGWKSLPVPSQPRASLKLSLLKRDARNRPFLANIVAPVTPGPIAAVVSVAAIPANVVIPEGY